MIPEFVSKLKNAKTYDLAQPYYIGMPHHPNHPPYLFSLVKKHGDYVSPVCGSSASEAVALGGHVGTHIDALCHFSKDGKLHDGSVAAEVQSYAGGLERLSVDLMRPLIGRGVLLDIAALAGVDILPDDFTITPEHLDSACQSQGVKVEAGDIVLLRVGPVLVRRRSLHQSGPRPRTTGTWSALAQRTQSDRCGLRYRRLRACAIDKHARSPPPVGRKRHSHHRSLEHGGTRG